MLWGCRAAAGYWSRLTPWCGRACGGAEQNGFARTTDSVVRAFLMENGWHGCCLSGTMKAAKADEMNGKGVNGMLMFLRLRIR